MLIAKFLNPNIDIEKEIELFERKHSVLLPIQYRTFLKRYNGGLTPETKACVKRFSEIVDAFYGVGNAEWKLEGIVRLSEWIGKGWLPIAYNGWGDYFAIGLNGEDEGKIYYFDYGRGYRKKFLADDLKHFFDCCKSGELNPVCFMSVEEREADLIARGKGKNITEGLKEAWQEQLDKYKDMVREEVIID